jgi:hypothetical protein
MVPTFPSNWLAERRSSHQNCKLTVDHLAGADAEPIDMPTDLRLDVLNENSGFSCQGPVAHPRIDIVQMVQDDPSRLVRLYRTAHNIGIEATHAAKPGRDSRQLANVRRNPGLSSY